MTHMHGGRVCPLGELDDYEVADHDPDVRGWNVRTADGTEIGEVDELLVEPAAKKVRYLSVDLNEDFGPERRVLVPIGAARLRRDDNDVVVEALSATDMRTLPAYTPGAIDDRYERDLRTRFSRGAADSRTDDLYSHELYDDRRFYGARR